MTTSTSKSNQQHPLSVSTNSSMGCSSDNLLNYSQGQQQQQQQEQRHRHVTSSASATNGVEATHSHPYHHHSNVIYSNCNNNTSSSTTTSHHYNNHTQSTSSPFLRKPIWLASSTPTPLPNEQHHQQNTNENQTTSQLHRHLSLFDLISVGVGSTVGSGIFVLCGLIARNYAGPATCLSWIISGAAACCSGLCYAELGALFPTAGSSYAYAYVTMGELPAVVAAACLTLEYVFSASAVARSWGDKIVEYYIQETHHSSTTTEEEYEKDWIVDVLLEPGGKQGYVNPMAFLVSSLSVLLLLNGVKESKFVTNLFTSIKVILILFLCTAGFMLFQKENLTPFLPAKFGMSGVFRGATSSFFGYIGYDEICCLAGEAQNPAKNLPRAIVWSLVIVTVLYVAAALALTGMVPYEDISATSGFPNGFRYRGLEWCAQISALGEIITLPLVVLVTIMAQPRLQYAMSIDGLLPPIFSRVDPSGNLWHGTLISGALMVLIATVVPFTYLDDLISAGILVAFSMTDASVILLRNKSPEHSPYLLEMMLCLFHVLSFVQGVVLGNYMEHVLGVLISVVIGVVLLGLVYGIATYCPKSTVFGSCGDLSGDVVFGGGATTGRFQTPCVPYLPLAGTFANWYLIAQLEFFGLFLLVVYISASIAYYFIYGAKNSVGNNRGWSSFANADVVGSGHLHHGGEVEGKGGYQTIDENDEHVNEDGYDQHQPLRTMISLPRVRRGEAGYMGEVVE